MPAEDFFSSYLAYTTGGECPPTFHRWSAISGLAALLERSVFIPYGHGEIYPNIYTMLIGNAGTRKSTAIKIVKNLLISSGYTTLAAERTSKEKYLADLSKQAAGGENGDDLDVAIFGSSNIATVTPNLIAADEANDFFGIGNSEFLSLLGSLWDWKGNYASKTKSGKDDCIPNPTITILSGNTPTGFSLAFPSTIFGQGFFSRLMLIYAEPTGARITFPTTPDKQDTLEMIKLMQQIKATSVGEQKFSPTAARFIDKIHKEHIATDDPRFEAFSNRRLTHLIKLCLIVEAARFETEISESTVLQANTYLTYVENLMPKALGEFGKSKNADVAHKVLTMIDGSLRPVRLQEIWKKVRTDLDQISDLSKLITKLLYAEQIQTVNSSAGVGFLPMKKEIVDELERMGLVSFGEFLTTEELGVKR